MTQALLNKLACPYDLASALKLSVFNCEGENITAGLLECPQCRRYYPIISGIPVMAPDEFRDASLEAAFLEKWQTHLGNRYGQGQGFTLPAEEQQTTNEHQ